MKDLQIDTHKSVAVSQIIPEQWNDWIWTSLSENAPFSWGDNFHSLVHAFAFKDHLEDVLDYESGDDEDVTNSINEYRQSVFDILNYLEAENIFVDMEE
jgi:hypothetical protein